mmetsp:Transcript_6990/g.13751  ORF Transcript_6990/g.13751 Transcript_6990/m.13751 type:complete len:340 (-) Transcript_6990:271-1290(-)
MHSVRLRCRSDSIFWTRLRASSISRVRRCESVLNPWISLLASRAATIASSRACAASSRACFSSSRADLAFSFHSSISACAAASFSADSCCKASNCDSRSFPDDVADPPILSNSMASASTCLSTWAIWPASFPSVSSILCVALTSTWLIRSCISFSWLFNLSSVCFFISSVLSAIFFCNFSISSWVVSLTFSISSFAFFFISSILSFVLLSNSTTRSFVFFSISSIFSPVFFSTTSTFSSSPFSTSSTFLPIRFSTSSCVAINSTFCASNASLNAPAPSTFSPLIVCNAFFSSSNSPLSFASCSSMAVDSAVFWLSMAVDSAVFWPSMALNNAVFWPSMA